MTAELIDRAVLITGVARGLGLATAEAFVAAGAIVVASDRDKAELVAAADRLAAASYLVGHGLVLDGGWTAV